MALDDSVTIEIDDIQEDFTGCATGECRVNVLPILFKISQIITDSEDLTSALTLILGVMEERMKIIRGMVSLYDRPSETIFVHASFGLTEEQKQRGIYSLGEGVTGRTGAARRSQIATLAKSVAPVRSRPWPSWM